MSGVIVLVVAFAWSILTVAGFGYVVWLGVAWFVSAVRNGWRQS